MNPPARERDSIIAALRDGIEASWDLLEADDSSARSHTFAIAQTALGYLEAAGFVVSRIKPSRP